MKDAFALSVTYVTGNPVLEVIRRGTGPTSVPFDYMMGKTMSMATLNFGDSHSPDKVFSYLNFGPLVKNVQQTYNWADDPMGGYGAYYPTELTFLWYPTPVYPTY